MKTTIVKFAFAVAVLAAPFAPAADRGAADPLPAPLHVANFSPTFAGYPGDLTLLAPPLTTPIKSNTGSLMFASRPRPEGAEAEPAVERNRVNIEDLRFNARIDGSGLNVQSPQRDLLNFTPTNGWNFKKAN